MRLKGISDQTALMNAASETTIDGQVGLYIDLGDGEGVFLIGLGTDDIANLALVT